ncbi:hypothetical protein HDU96_001398 [Phlyctochytrium bullatum]|nr:hypothetical protein HDU96_001398 [Phlyctochytrium bullatum]
MRTPADHLRIVFTRGRLVTDGGGGIAVLAIQSVENMDPSQRHPLLQRVRNPSQVAFADSGSPRATSRVYLPATPGPVIDTAAMDPETPNTPLLSETGLPTVGGKKEGSCELCKGEGHAAGSCPRMELASTLLSGYDRRESAALKPSNLGSISTSSKMIGVSKAAAATLPWLLNNYGWVALSASWIISLPLAVYKWNLAHKQEEQEALRTFAELADSIIDAAIVAWNFASSGSLMMASFYLSQHPNVLPASAFANYTNSKEYFTYLNRGVILGLYRNITAANRAWWEEELGKAYGPTMGSNTTLGIYNRTSSGNVRDSLAQQLFVTVLISDVEANRVSLGFNAYGAADRRRCIDAMLRTGVPCTTERMQLARSASLTPGVVTMAPLFSLPGGAAMSRERTGELAAVAFTSCECRQVVANGMAGLTFPDWADFFLWDMDGAANQSFLAHYSRSTHEVYDNYTLAMYLTESAVRSSAGFEFVQSRDFNLTNRNWRMQVAARPGYVNAYRSQFPIKLFFIALIDPMFSLVFHLTIMVLHKKYGFFK